MELCEDWDTCIVGVLDFSHHAPLRQNRSVRADWRKPSGTLVLYRQFHAIAADLQERACRGSAAAEAQSLGCGVKVGPLEREWM